MEKLAFYILMLTFATSCNYLDFGTVESAKDNWNYESITNSVGTVYVKIGDSLRVYEHAKIVYSEADATTMLIKTKESKYVYIQGPALIEFDTFNADD